MNKKDLITYLDSYLKIGQYKDLSKNGLQVDNSGQEIKRIGYAVDTTSYIFDKAIEQGVDMIVAHHGMFWDFDFLITGVYYDRMSKLIKNDIALYGCHLPLDGHQDVGNNIVMLNKFVDYFKIQDFEILQKDHSFGIKFKEDINYSDVEGYCKSIGIIFGDYNFGNKKKINSIFFSSGGGLSLAKQANDLGYDLFITGEGAHYEISLAKDIKQSVILGGHYETEIFGVKALAENLQKEFGIEIVFLDEKY